MKCDDHNSTRRTHKCNIPCVVIERFTGATSTDADLLYFVSLAVMRIIIKPRTSVPGEAIKKWLVCWR